jgi:hypothetical protein
MVVVVVVVVEVDNDVVVAEGFIPDVSFSVSFEIKTVNNDDVMNNVDDTTINAITDIILNETDRLGLMNNGLLPAFIRLTDFVPCSR